MIFVFDLDDTLCDTDSYSEEFILDFFKKNNLPFKQIAKVVRYAEAKFNWDSETALSWYKTYGDEMMLNFPIKENALKFLNQLKKNGHKIIIATARANDWHNNPEEITKAWLENNKVPYDKLYIGRADKEVICKDENADVFVDDDIKITERVASHNKNMKVFLASTPYNKTQEISEIVTRIETLQEINEKLFNNELSK